MRNFHSTQRVLGVFVAITAGLMALSATAFAQESTAPAGPITAAGQCPAAEPVAPAILTQLREQALEPGKKIDPAAFMKDPQVVQAIGEMTKREQARKQSDWSGLCRYREANAAQRAKGALQVVFLGDSITENWVYADPALFTDKALDRGIGGQTSSQILLRFYPDVVALHPKVVHILAGTNDILQNIGPVGDDDIVNNISAMIDIAQFNHIKVVLGSILPISVRTWQPDLKPAPRLLQLNERLKVLAAARKVVFIDYFAALKDANNELNADFGNDGVHPNRAGYALMKPLALRAIE